MAKKIYFTPGPSDIYFTVEEHIKNALKEQIPAISHRSKRFQEIYAEAETNLRKLFNLPENFHLVFTASATEVWERLVQNCVEKESFHFVNGSFSQRFYEIAGELGRTAHHVKADYGNYTSVAEAKIPATAELISVTQNETSTGVAFPQHEIEQLKATNPDALIAVDFVSSAPVSEVDFNLIDTAYLSVQKCFGLPAGLGVWFYNDRCLAKAQSLHAKGLSIGSYHTLPKLHEGGLKKQTPETPNVLNIYLLAKVAGDMLTKGLDRIRIEATYKSTLLYTYFENHSVFSPFVKNPAARSKTVIVAETGKHTAGLIEFLKSKGMVVGSGYGPFKETHIRVANFPTHSKESMEQLVDTIDTFTL
jgi:phosphoserine aminotransferase